MGLTLNKRLRIAIISILIFLILITSYLIYHKIANPGFEEQKNTLYAYNNKSQIDYKVLLKQNNLYTGTFLDEGKLYITEFVDFIDANLKYEFTGERAADVKGEYNIIAKVQGFNGEGEKLLNIWEKEFPIIQNKLVNTNDGKVSINENVKINHNDFNIFVKQIKESSKINCQATLSLYMDVKLTGTTDQGAIEETITPSLLIPLDVSMFEITESNIVDEPKSIEETNQVELPVNKKLVLIYGIILFILIVALILLIIFVKNKPIKEPLEKELDKIFKKHGDRLVALNSDMVIQDSMAISSDILIKNSIYVNSFEDLVRISDELSKPILYRYSKNYKEINKFYVSNDDEKFVFNLKSSNKFNDNNDIRSVNSSKQIKMNS